ncbi:MAG: hypothetical protein ACOY0T_28290 [Myxococcota bacterium]
MSNESPFEREDLVSEPGIVGASWWQRSLADAQKPVTRRSAIGLALGAGGAVLGFGALVALLAHSCSDDDDHLVERRNSLQMQRAFGWSFGAAQESVTFDGKSLLPFDRSALSQMVKQLRPQNGTYAGYYSPNLFESPSARPTEIAEGAPESIVPLDQVLMPIFTASMREAFLRGRGLGSLFTQNEVSDVLVICDLDGPESVAFAAGARTAFDPVFIFGNWPHPRGVVPAHRTLAAAAYFQPLFAEEVQDVWRRPMLVLDRQRLAPYKDDADQFDNRYMPVLPNADILHRWGVRKILYVAPSSTDTSEQPDLNDEFVAYKNAGLEVRILAADAFAPDSQRPTPDPSGVPQLVADGATTERYFYGGRAATHQWFWHDYPWSARALPAATEPNLMRPGRSYVPHLSSTATTLLAAGAIGTVAVAISRNNGRILGALMNRSGSWNRADGGYGG